MEPLGEAIELIFKMLIGAGVIIVALVAVVVLLLVR